MNPDGKSRVEEGGFLGFGHDGEPFVPIAGETGAASLFDGERVHFAGEITQGCGPRIAAELSEINGAQVLSDLLGCDAAALREFVAAPGEHPGASEQGGADPKRAITSGGHGVRIQQGGRGGEESVIG